MGIEKAVSGLREAARKDTAEALSLLCWTIADLMEIEQGLLEQGKSIGEYNDNLRHIRAYTERLTRLSIQSYGCEEAIKALNEIDEKQGGKL